MMTVVVGMVTIIKLLRYRKYGAFNVNLVAFASLNEKLQ